MYTVYLLDDEFWLLESLEAIIEWNKYDSVVVGKETSSIKAYEEIKRLNPDIVFTDIRMPDMNGMELMEKIKSWKKETVVVLVTGYAEFEYARQALLHNVADYCLKPIEEEAIVDALKKAQKICDKQRVLVSLERKEDKEEKSNSDTFNIVIKYIEENFKKNITLNEIADRFYFNPAYLSMLIKKELGKNFILYLNELRINYACELLEKTDLSISEIGNSCGINNYFYFARLFKRNKGLTPTEYRKII